ncbi:MAG: hypothetical protein AAF726_25275 [Planctomycetota bacterium]
MKNAVIALLALTGSSCASIMTGGSDTVLVQSVPSGASFSTNTGARGRTPQSIVVPASQDLVVNYKLSGYESTTAIVESRFSGWIVGNILFGGFIGLAVDLLNPDAKTHDGSISVTLLAQDGFNEGESDMEGPKSALASDFEAARDRRRRAQE